MGTVGGRGLSEYAASDAKEAIIVSLGEVSTAHVSLACRDCAEAAWEAVAEVLEARGLVIVPREPTPAMIAVINDWFVDDDDELARRFWAEVIDKALE